MISRKEIPELCFAEMDGCEEIIAAMVEQFFVGGDTGGNQFGHASFYNALGLFGIFELVADSYAVTGFYQFM